VKLHRLPVHLSLAADRDGVEVPAEIEVLDLRGDPVAHSTLAGDRMRCRKDAGTYKQRFAEVLDVDEVPATIVVEEAALPERIGFEIRFPEACQHHGWDCPLWVREAVFRRR